MRIGILTGGGDCPGLNAVIRAAVIKGAVSYGDEFVGFTDGWRGMLQRNTMPLDSERCRDILPLGGTILGSSRTNPFSQEEGPERIAATFNAERLDAVIAIGGEDTLGVAARLADSVALPVVGVPKTIDNDIAGTEVTFGFQTAVQTATDAIDRLRTTAESHHRVIVCEVMGRNAGWIAIHAGIAGGAAEILVPEEPFDIAAICTRIERRHASGLFSSIVVVAEGASPATNAQSTDILGGSVQDGGTQGNTDVRTDQFGHERLGGISNLVAQEIERRTGIESRVTILGHIQRGGTPTAFDRVLATRFGVEAIEACHDSDFQVMVALHAGKIERIPITTALSAPKTADMSLIHEVAEAFLG